jgi:hypothetical protein
MKAFSFGLSLVLFVTGTFAQGVYRFQRADSVPVFGTSGKMPNPWAGGLNFVLAGELDLDGDAKNDLVVFDKSGNRIVPFLNRGTVGQIKYVHAPDYRRFFPQITDWMLLRDYDRDGKADIFAYYSGGTKVFRNVSAAPGQIAFQEVVYLLESDYGSTVTSLFIPSSDLPGIEDLDGDGDLDILAFDVFGGCVDYHKNLSMELFGHADSLTYELVTRNWGNFSEDGVNNSVYLDSDCGRSLRGHAGSTFLLLDVNGDQKKDLALGDINFNNLVFLLNGGTIQQADMVQVQTDFPQGYGGSLPVNTTIFPAASYQDLNNDGIRDLFVAPTGDGRSQNRNGIWFYRNNGFDSLPSFQLAEQGFLQNGMIDLGEGAYPVWVDFDSDGLKDIVVGNFGYFISNANYDSRLTAYKNIGTATEPSFSLFSADFGGLSQSGLDGLVPTFGDLDADGDEDLVVGESNGRLHYYRNTAPSGQPAQFVLQTPFFGGIQEPLFSAPCLFDLNEDGKLDLLVGSRNGKLNYYQNTGTAQMAQFSATPTVANAGGVNTVDQTQSFFGFSTPFVFPDANDFQLFCGSYSGRIYHHKGLKGNLNGNWPPVTFVADSLIYDGFRTAVSLSDINADGKWDMLLGNYSGGLALLYGLIVNTSVSEWETASSVRVFPVPAEGMLHWEIPAAWKGIRVTLSELNGKILLDKSGAFGEIGSLDVSSLSAGLYFLTFYSSSGAEKVVKWIKQ